MQQQRNYIRLQVRYFKSKTTNYINRGRSGGASAFIFLFQNI